MRKMKKPIDGKGHPLATLEKITSYFHRIARPIYVGYVSLEIGYSLAQTDAMMTSLKDSGVIRPLTIKEKLELKIMLSDHVWTLTEIPRLSKAKL